MGDPTENLTRMAEGLAEGNFTQEFQAHFPGELGQLATYLDSLQQSLKTLSPTLGSSAYLVPQVAKAVADITQQTEMCTNSMLELMEEMLTDQERMVTLLRERKEHTPNDVGLLQIEQIADKSRNDLIRLTSYLSFQDVVRQRAAKVQRLIGSVEEKISHLQAKFNLDVSGHEGIDAGLSEMSQEEATEFVGETGIDQNSIDNLFEKCK